MTKQTIFKNGFLLAAGIGGGLLAKAMGVSSDTALVLGGLSVVVALLGFQSKAAKA